MNETNKSKNNDGNGSNIPNDHHEVSRNKPWYSSNSIFSGIFKKKSPNNNESETNDEKYRKFQIFGIMANLIMVAFFIFSIFYQGCLTRKSIELSEKAFNMTKISNYNDSIMTVKDTLARERVVRMEFRAYLSIAEFEITSFSEGKQLEYMIYIKNTGKTPAQNIRVVGGCKNYRPDVYINDFDSLNNTNPVITSVATGGDIEFHVVVSPDIDLTEKYINEITNGIYPLYILGTINYEDVFGDKHYTRYCRRVIRGPSGKFSFRYYKMHNEEQ